jgi:tRNA(Arg) A34 adenosine deaminase TadA
MLFAMSPSRTVSPLRRRLLGGAAAALTSLLAPTRRAAADAGRPIRQPAAPSRAAFMARAVELRDAAARGGDQPYGAAVVKDGRIVGEAPSRVVTARDPTAHAEMEAIRDAARRLGTRDLSGCEIYASTRPCPMCEAAAYWAGIVRIYHGTAAEDAGAPRLARC